MVEGKNRVSTDKLSGGARIHYIFQSIFVKSLEVRERNSFKYLASRHVNVRMTHQSVRPWG
jgi:hypothetical protein